MASEADDLQDQIDQLEGNDTAIEDRRHEKKLADIQAEADANGTQNTLAYRNLIALEDQLHTLKLKNIQSEADAQAKSDASDTASSTKPTTSSGGAANDDAAPAASGSAGGAVPAINIDLSKATFVGSGPASQSEFAETLARIIIPQMQAIQNRSK